MSHIKLYEEFNLEDFSSTYFETVDRDKFIEWWITSKDQSKYKFKSSEDLRSVTNNIDRICKNNFGDGEIYFEIYDSDYQVEDDLDVQNLGLIIFTPDSNKSRRLFVRTSIDQKNGLIEFGVIAFEIGSDYKTQYVEKLHTRVPLIGEFFICNGFDGFEDCLDKLVNKGFIEKPSKEPKSYKHQQVLTDDDFESRNIDNQMRSMFYKEYGRILKDISLDLPFEERRSKSLELLNNWSENLQ